MSLLHRWHPQADAKGALTASAPCKGLTHTQPDLRNQNHFEHSALGCGTVPALPEDKKFIHSLAQQPFSEYLPQAGPTQLQADCSLSTWKERQTVTKHTDPSTMTTRTRAAQTSVFQERSVGLPLSERRKGSLTK